MPLVIFLCARVACSSFERHQTRNQELSREWNMRLISNYIGRVLCQTHVVLLILEKKTKATEEGK